MHSPEYRARIRKMIDAKGMTEESMKRILFHFRNGRSPSPEEVAGAKTFFADFLAVLEEPKPDTLHLVNPGDVMNAGNRDYKTLCGMAGKSTLYLRDVTCAACREMAGH